MKVFTLRGGGKREREPMLSGKVTIYAVTPIVVLDVQGENETEVLENAILRAEKELHTVTGGSFEIARLELETRRPSGLETLIFHDADHLNQLHEEHLGGAEIFSLPDLVPEEPVGPSAIRYPNQISLYA